MIHNAIDWTRLLNGVLAIWTTGAMALVTWRLAPRMRWYELMARQFIVVAFLSFAYGTFESLATHAIYGLRIWLATFAFTGTTIAFTAWAKHCPKRPPNWRNKKGS